MIITGGVILTIQDRGTMKWVSLMLPEHVALLQDALTEYEEKPILDEQKMIEIDRKLKLALEEHVALKMTYYQSGEVQTVYSKLLRIDQTQGYIVLRNEDGTMISLHNIIDVDVISAM